MIAYILCGGKGKRVKDITYQNSCAKHEIPILGKEFIEYIYEWLDTQKIVTEVYLLGTPGVGTGGAIKWITPVPDIFPFLMIYGDCFSPIDIDSMYEYHLRQRCDLTIATREVRTSDYGVVDCSGNLVVRYRRHHEREVYKTNIGTYLIDRRVFDYIRNCVPHYDSSLRQSWKIGSISLENDIFANDKFFELFSCYQYGTSELDYLDVGTPDRIRMTEVILSERVKQSIQ